MILQPSSTKITCQRVKEWVSGALISHFRSQKCKKSLDASITPTSLSRTKENDLFLENQRAILENLYNEMIEKCKTELNIINVNCK